MLLLKSKQEILAAVLRNSGINVNGLLKIVGTLRDIKKILNGLEKNGLLESKYVGNNRLLYPAKTEVSKTIYALIEMEEKNRAKKKYTFIESLENRMEQFHQLMGENLISTVLFGSIARGGMTKDSDIDVLFIVQKNEKVPKQKIMRLLENLSKKIGKEINPQWIEKKQFINQLKDSSSFACQVQKNRIIVYGITEFLEMEK